jgi:hypothetical protein
LLDINDILAVFVRGRLLDSFFHDGRFQCHSTLGVHCSCTKGALDMALVCFGVERSER